MQVTVTVEGTGTVTVSVNQHVAERDNQSVLDRYKARRKNDRLLWSSRLPAKAFKSSVLK